MSPIRRLEVSVNQQTKGLTVESIAIPLSLTLELQPEGADIGSLERAVSAGLADVARQLWAELISRLERSLVVGRGHVGCGGIVKANGRAARRIVTLAGEVGLSVGAIAVAPVAPRSCRSTSSSVSRPGPSTPWASVSGPSGS